MTDAPYFVPAPRTPGELVISRLIMVATAAITIVVVALYAIVSPVTAQWIGTMIGVNALNVAGGVIALFMRPGRRWVRWALIVVSAFRCLTILTYYILPGGFTYTTFLLLPIVVIVAVNLPGARAYFAEEQ